MIERSANAIDALLDAIGWLLIGLVLYVVVAEFLVAALRYGAGFSRSWLAESVLAANAALFLLGAAYAYRHDQHVRVDVFSKRWSMRQRDIVEIVGIIAFFLPFCLLCGLSSLDYVQASFSMNEHSREADGLPALWLQKALIPIASALLALAGLSRLGRCVLRLRDNPNEGV